MKRCKPVSRKLAQSDTSIKPNTKLQLSIRSSGVHVMAPTSEGSLGCLAAKTKRSKSCGEQTKVLDRLASSKLPVPESYPKGITTDEELARCGQKDVKLKRSDELTLLLTAESMINQFVYPTINMKHTLKLPDKNPSNACSPMYHPPIECLSVLRGLVTYAESLAPNYSAGLFQEKQENALGEGIIGGWIQFTQLPAKKAQYFASFGDTERSQFACRLSQIMRASVGVNIFNWVDCSLGYIFGFWLAKLYNQKGISDEDLPTELYQAKHHFLELYGYEYDAAEII